MAVGPALSAPSAACHEVERRLELIKSEITSTQLNAVLFQAADRGCEPLARALLAGGASVDARDRFGARPLSHAARFGHLPVVDLLLARGAPIDARNLAGATALYSRDRERSHGGRTAADRTRCERLISPGAAA